MPFNKLNQMKLSEKEQLVLNKFEKYLHDNKVSNDFLVQFIELAGSYLNLQTISYYAKSNNMSYNGVKKCRLVTEIFGTKYVIDNE